MLGVPPPSVRPTGPLRFSVTPDALLGRAGKRSHAKGIERPHLPPSGEHTLCGNSLCIMCFLGFLANTENKPRKAVTDETQYPSLAHRCC
jgi:hypothetical protein